MVRSGLFIDSNPNEQDYMIWLDQDYSLNLTLMNKIISLAGKGTPQELTQGLKCSTLDPLKVSSSGNGADI